MKSVFDFYKNQLHKHQEKHKAVKNSLLVLGTLRLVVFSLIIVLLYFFFKNTKAISIIGIIGIGLFLFLVKRHGKLKNTNAKLLALIKLNKTEIDVIENNALSLDEGAVYLNATHKFSYDIDLFGKGSFFQYLNRTATQSGKDKLANLLTSNNIENIESKQEGIEELAQKPKWRQEFSATASLVKIETKSENIITWMQNYTAVIPKIMLYLPLLFLLISVTLFVLQYFDLVKPSHIIIWFFIGLGVSGRYFKTVTELSHNANLAKDTFKQYFQLLQQLENTKFKASTLVEKQKLITTEKQKASKIFKAFSKILNALDQRNNLLFGVVANAFSLWDLKHSYRIEQWIANNGKQVEKWFDIIAFFDAQNSLANYRFNHPEHVFPILTTGSNSIKSDQLGHPLLDIKKRIDNDFTINKESFYIITGANMAGKSTFLRAVSLSIVMANIGLPVCAKSYHYSPIKLITSMRTSDSLSNDESYFFSELKRLKFIIDAIAKEKHFIVLDEILKGTNSTDKAIGSRKFVKKLVGSQSTGIIATHDLSLCEITTALPQVNNYYFDAEIIDDELFFDYTLKEGICKNMNASFLLTKMGIV